MSGGIAQEVRPREQILVELRARHGDIDALQLDPENPGSAIVVLRKPTLAEYLDAAEVISRRESGQRFRDPAEITRPLLELVVYGLEEARAELNSYPAFDVDLEAAVKRLAGNRPDVQLDEAADAITEEVKASTPRALAFRCDGLTVICRPLDRFDWTNFQSEAAQAREGMPATWYSPRVLAKLVDNQAVESRNKEGRKPGLDELGARWPLVIPIIGMSLAGAAMSKAKRIEGK